MDFFFETKFSISGVENKKKYEDEQINYMPSSSSVLSSSRFYHLSLLSRKKNSRHSVCPVPIMNNRQLRFT